MNKPTLIWQSDNDIGAVRMVAFPIAHNGGPCESKYAFEKRMANDAMGNECWVMLFEPAWQDAPGKLRRFFEHVVDKLIIVEPQ